MCSIVIADDEYLEREFIKKIINQIDGTKIVGEVNSGLKAVELCFLLKPNVIILNRGMGGIDGIEASRQIRETNKNIIIIMTSALEKKLDENTIKIIDIDEFLLKPIRPNKLEEIIKKYSTICHDNNTPYSAKKNIKYYPTHLISKEINTVLTYINEHFRENISLDYLAQSVFLSKYYFCRLFKKEVGVNFSSYVLHMKMEEAKILLKSSNKTILDISVVLNFKQQNYFSKVFKENTGVTPTEYRSSALKSSSEIKQLVDNYNKDL